ncbi:hypothetical protein [Kitasatospora sp. NPDC004531]
MTRLHRPAPSPWTRVGGALVVASALIPAAAAWFLFGVMLPDDTKSYRAYTAAAACPADKPPAAVEGCVRTVPFTVVSATVHGGKGHSFRATVTGTPFWDGELSFGDPGPVVEDLEPGDHVNGTVWRGRVMTLEQAGTSQATADKPRNEPQFTAGLGTYAALAAALIATLGILRSTGRPAPLDVFRWTLLTTFLACAVPTVLAFLTSLPWWTVPTTATPLALALAEAVRRWNTTRIANAPKTW